MMRIGSILLLLLGTFSNVQSYDLKSCVIDCGGVSILSTTGYFLGGSVGQNCAAKVWNTSHILYAGYYTPKNAPPGIEETSQISLRPMVFNLGQNYPNPVRHRTFLQYSLPQTSIVKLQLFDVAGRQVAVIVDDCQEPGLYKVNWSIHSVSEKKLPNGVYFYRLQAGDFVQTKKMIICR